MKLYRKSNKGFTLVEMIISIAFLAIISLVLVELFIGAQNCLQKAHDLDQGVHIAKKMVETFKSGDGPEDFINSEIVSISDISELGDNITIKIYYDKAWQVVDPMDDRLQEKTAFIATSEIKPTLNDTGSYTNNGLYSISVLVDKSKPYVMEKTSASEIYSLTADKFFNRLIFGGA